MTLVVTDLVAPARALSLTVGAGEIVALAGHDTGRTAAVQAIAGLERPRAGSIALAGQEITGAAPDRIAAPRPELRARRAARVRRADAWTRT